MDTQSQQDFKVLEGEISRDPVTSLAPKARSFVKFLSNTVAPRVAYLDKNARKVVRFAVDLPNKTKLGVRLEESGGSLTLCFICSDPESLEMLGFTKEAFPSPCPPSRAKPNQSFSNYKEMDEHFTCRLNYNYKAMIDAAAQPNPVKTQGPKILPDKRIRTGATCRWRTFSNCSPVRLAIRTLWNR